MALADDAISALLRDWRQLSSADRDAIRAQLSSGERKLLDRALAPAPPAPKPTPKLRPLAEIFADCSPLLAKRLCDLAGENGEHAAGEATRAAVRAIAAERRLKCP